MAFGTDVAWMKRLMAYWRNGFDWRAQEARLNAFPQYKVALHGIDLHFLHVAGKGPNPLPLLLSHGWPGSVFAFLEIIPRLTDPERFGGDPDDAFTVVAPSLPGYGLSLSPGQPRFGIEAIADCFAELMSDLLGYSRFGAQGGDWGSFIASRLGVAYPERMIGIHLNLMPIRHDPNMVADPTPQERQFLDELAVWLKEETGYQWIQGTRPRIRRDPRADPGPWQDGAGVAVVRSLAVAGALAITHVGSAVVLALAAAPIREGLSQSAFGCIRDEGVTILLIEHRCREPDPRRRAQDAARADRRRAHGGLPPFPAPQGASSSDGRQPVRRLRPARAAA